MKLRYSSTSATLILSLSLLVASSTQLSASDHVLAVSAEIDEERHVIIYDVGDQRLLKTFQVAESPIQPSWTPDGSAILFTGAQSRANATGSIYALNVRTEKVTPVSLLPPHSRMAQFHPKGTSILFGKGLRSINLLDGFGKFTANVRTIITKSYAVTDPRWAPDGESIFYSAWSRKEGWSIWECTIEGKSHRKICFAAKYGCVYPDVSPDGKTLVYSRVDSRYGPGNIYTVDRETGKTKALTSNSKSIDMQPVWSPDGKFIAYIHYNYRYDNGTVRLLHLETGKVSDVEIPRGSLQGDQPQIAWRPVAE